MLGRTTCAYCKLRIRVANSGEAYGHYASSDKQRFCMGSFIAVDLDKVDRPAPKASELVPVQMLPPEPEYSWWDLNGGDVIWWGATAALGVAAFVAGWTLACFGVPWA